MVTHAANPAAQPNSSLNAPLLAISSGGAATEVSRFEWVPPTAANVLAGVDLPLLRIKIVAGRNRVPLARGECFRPISRPLLGVTLRGLSGALRHGVALLSRDLPEQVWTAAERTPPTLLPGPANKALLDLGSRAHSLGFAWCDPSSLRELNETEITTMYQNKVTLIGFLGNDAEVRTNNGRSLTTLSLATKSSYKKDEKYVEHTEWHRCVVFAKLGEFAATLKKGAHLQVEGELRSRKYQSTKTNAEQTIWEIRVDSILKLNRAAKAAGEDGEDTPDMEAA